MKKWNLLLSMLFISSAIFVTSCNKDEEEAGPTLNLKGQSGYTSSDVTVNVGTTITIGVIGSAGDNNLSEFEISVYNNNQPAFQADTTFNSSSLDLNIPITFTQDELGENVITMTLTDKKGKTDQQSFTVTVEAIANVTKYSDVELGSHNDALGSFFATTTGDIFTIGQLRNNETNQELVDFIFFKGDANENSIASPDNETVQTIETFELNDWTGHKNETRFNTTTITAAEFDAIGDTYTFPDFNTTPAAQLSLVNNLADNQVILFKTEAGKLGLIKIVDLYSRGDRALIDVIVME